MEAGVDVAASRSVKIYVVWGLTLGLAIAACTKVSRRFVDIVGNPASLGAMASAALFERRSGVLLAIPDGAIAGAIEDFRAEYSDKQVALAESLPKKSKKVLGMDFTYDVSEATLGLCLAASELVPSGTGTVSLDLVADTCGLRLEVKDAKLKLHPDGDGVVDMKPIVLSVKRMALKDPKRADRIRLRARFAFDAAGGLVLETAELVEGLSYILDPNEYDLDIELTGFEAYLGQLGMSVNELRAQLILDLLDLNRYRLEQTFHKSLRKGFGKLADALHARAGDTSLAVSGDVAGVRFAIGAQPSGFAAGRDGGIALLTSGLLKVETSGLMKRLPCSVKRDVLPEAEPVWAGELEKVYDFSPPMDTPAIAGSSGERSTTGRVVLPKNFVDYALWQIFGDKGECRFPLAAGEKNLGEVVARYESPLRLRAVPVVSPAEGGITTLDLVFTIPQLKVDIGSALLTELGRDDVPDQTDLVIPSFDYVVHVALGKTLVLAVDGQERYAKLTTLDMGVLASDVTGAIDPKDPRTTLDALTRVALVSILSQTVAPLFEAKTLELDQLGEELRLMALTAENGDVSASYRFTQKVTPPPPPGVTLALVEAPESSRPKVSDALAALGLPALLGVAASDVVAALDEVATCERHGEEMTLPDASFDTVRLLYARCGPARNGLEARFLAAATDESGGEVVVHARLKAEGNALGAAPFTLSYPRLREVLGEPKTSSASGGVVTASWKLQDAMLSVRGSCMPLGGDCSAGDSAGSTQIAEVSLWLN